MDEPAQIVEPAGEIAPAEGDERSYVREDGTLVINVLFDPPCGTTVEGEIVVCASGESPHRYDPPPEPPAEEGVRPELQLGQNTKLRARAETDSMTGADRVMVDLIYKF